jgi:EAL domain-containing protein (putative c-di-GMP-specific phosphodiesterase class I)
LRRAIDRSELFVVYQPLFRLDDGAVTGAEALVRWRHPQRGVVLPGEFIPLAEQRGLIGEIDSFVLNEACRQLAEWRTDDDPWDDFMMSVNVSGRELSDPGLVDRVAATLERHRIAPSRLCLEITETALIGELGNVNQAMASLSTLGVHLALDDFGTGYSTLAHLQLLPTDILKIDRSFVAQIGEQTRDREIIAAVTAMAHALGMSVVGEGIETNGQREKLLGLDCDEGQGYVFAPPMPPANVAALRAANPSAQARLATPTQTPTG